MFLLFLLGRGQHHGQLSAFHFCFLFYCSELGKVLFQTLHQFGPDLLMGHLAAAEPEGYLGFVPIGQETYQVAQFYLIISFLRPWTKLHFLDLDCLLLLAVGRTLLLEFEDVLAIVHDLADNRVGFGRNQHEIQPCCPRNFQGLLNGDNTLLSAVLENQTNVLRVDLVIYRRTFAPVVVAFVNSRYST